MATEVKLPLDQPNAVEAEVVRWLVPEGHWAEAGVELVEVESSKAVTTVVAPTGGYLRPLAQVGDSVKVGSVLAYLHPTTEELTGDPTAAPDGDAAASASTAGEGAVGGDPEEQLGVRFSASGRQELLRHGLSPTEFRGYGLVTAQVVQEVAAQLARPATPQEAAGRESTVPVQRHRIGPGKRTEIDRLTAGSGALVSALTVQFSSAQLRASLNQRPGTQPLVLAVLIYHLARLLREFPELNARFAEAYVEHYTKTNVGVAVDLGQGLRVPVIRDADQLDPVEITVAYLDAMAAYHERRLSTDDVTGGTVTVSDLSGNDVYQFHPLLNQEQTLALGVGGDSGAPGHPMTITAIFDHRVSTGRTVAGFLGQLKEALLGESAV